MDSPTGNTGTGGLANLMSAAQNIAKAIGQLNQTLSNLIITVANTWTALQTFSAGIVSTFVTTPSIAPASGANLVLGGGAALGLTVTSGWVEIPSCAGTPTGVPSNAAAGKIAIVYDSTGHKIWVYDPIAAAWKGVAVA